MARYWFRAADARGEAREGEAQAESTEALVAHLRGQGLTVLDVRETEAAPPGAAEPGGLALDLGVSRGALTFFTRQLATTLRAGLPLLRILALLHKQASNRSLRRVVDDLGRRIQEGESLSAAMAHHPAVFDGTYLNMVRVGETSGTLPESVARLADLRERDAALRQKVASALAYPAFVLVFTILVAYALLAFMMPGFSPIFASSGLDLRNDYPLTWVLMATSALVTRKWFLVAAAAAIGTALLALRLASRHPQGRYVLDAARFHAPLFHPLVREGAVARFCRTFAILTQSGVPLLKALALVADSAGNLVITRAVEKVARGLQEGDRLAETLASTGVFPDLAVQMVAVGEESGTLPEMMERVAEYYEAQLEARVNALTAMIEPAMVVVVGLMVGVVVMGVLLPILGLSQGQGGQVK